MNDRKEELDAEELRLRRLNALWGVAQIIARRWLWAFLAALVVVSGALTALLARRAARSCERAVVTTKLQFYPKSAAKIPALDAKQVLQILTRAALVRSYIEEAGLVGVERLRAWIDLSVEQNRWDPRLFEITTKASTEARAVEKANAFADVCLKEYEAYRRAELEKWLTTIGARRQELTDQIAQVDGEEQRLARTNGLLSPEEDADRLRTTISDQKVRLSEAAVRVTNGALRAKRLKEELGAVSVKAFGRADELKALQEDVLRAEKEVARLRTLYTDKNPRLAVVLKAQADSRAKLDAFLRENEMPAMTSVELERLTAVYEKLKDTEIEYEVQKSGKEALEKEIAANERQLTTLVRLLPQFEGFRRRRETLQATIQGLEETISDIRYLQASVSGDLAQVERATGGKVASPLSRKNVALGLAGGLFAAGGLLALLVLADFAFGRVRSPREVACYLGVRLLGAVVPKDRCPKGVEHKDLIDRICFRLEKEAGTRAVVFFGLLPGCRFVDELAEAMHWNLTMSGRHSVLVEIVEARTFREPEGAEALSTLYVKGAKAWFAVASLKALSPSETRLLAEDVAILRRRFDVVALRCARPIASDIFLRQALELAEACVFHVGARRTPRRLLRRLVACGEQAGKEPLVIVDGRLSYTDLSKEAI